MTLHASASHLPAGPPLEAENGTVRIPARFLTLCPDASSFL